MISLQTVDLDHVSNNQPCESRWLLQSADLLLLTQLLSKSAPIGELLTHGSFPLILARHMPGPLGCRMWLSLMISELYSGS